MAAVAAYNQQTGTPTLAGQTQRSAAANASLPERASDAQVSASTAGSSDGGRVAVPAAAMEENLISSRVPVYPAEAKANHVGGRVVMQATINRDGSVGHLHVLSGEPELRRAAMEAVSSWQYRPYLVNGQPVEVSTTISVDFSSIN
jgi:TonB family protein